MKDFIKAILAGILIGLCGFAYLSIDNKYVGAFLFSFGLLTILIKGYNLFTGKVHLWINDINNFNNIKLLAIILLGNIIGSFVMGKLVSYCICISTNALWEIKLGYSFTKALLLAIFCGMLMYLAVTNWNLTKNPIYVIMPIMIFILAGCEHSIANVFYLGLVDKEYFGTCVAYIVVNILGNTLGATILYGLDKLRLKFNKN